MPTAIAKRSLMSVPKMPPAPPATANRDTRPVRISDLPIEYAPASPDEPSPVNTPLTEWARLKMEVAQVTLLREAVVQLTKRVSELERARDAMRQEMLEWYRERERRGKIP